MKNQINFSGSTLIATRDEKELQLNIEDLYFIYNDDYFNIMLDESHTNSGLAVFSSMYSDLLVDGEAFTGGADDLEALVKSHIGGGGEITIDAALDANSTNAVANSAITTAINGRQLKMEYVGSDNVFESIDTVYGRTIIHPMFRCYSNNSTNTKLVLNNKDLGLYFPIVNGKKIFSVSKYETNWLGDVIEASAITTSVTSASTDSQVPSAKAVYNALGDIETLLSQI